MNKDINQNSSESSSKQKEIFKEAIQTKYKAYTLSEEEERNFEKDMYTSNNNEARESKIENQKLRIKN